MLGDINKLEREQQAVLVAEYWKAEFDGRTPRLDMKLVKPLAKMVYKPLYIMQTIILNQIKFQPGFRRVNFSVFR